VTQVTRFGPLRATTTNPTLGRDPALDEIDESVPVAEDQVPLHGAAEVKVPVSGTTIAVVQVAHSFNTSTGTGTVSMASPVTAGNILFLVVNVKATEDWETVPLPTGFAVLAGNEHSDSGVNAHGLAIAAKVSDGTEQTISSGFSDRKGILYLEVSGFGGAIPVTIDIAVDEFSAVDHATMPAVSLSGGSTAFVLAAIYKKTDGPNPGPSTLTGYTNGPDTGFHGIGGLQRLTSWYVATNSSGTSYGGGTVSFTPSSSCSGVAVNIAMGQVDSVWDPAPEVGDEDDASYSVSAMTDDNLRVDFSTALLITRSILKVGTLAAGTRTFELYGDNDPDFGSEVLLDTQAFSSAGSYTPADVTFSWTATTAYRYYRVKVADADTYRYFAWEMYPALPVSEADLAAYQLRSEKGQPDGYAGLDSGGLVPAAQLPMSDALPLAEFEGGAAGTDDEISRSDHQHPVPTAVAAIIGVWNYSRTRGGTPSDKGLRLSGNPTVGVANAVRIDDNEIGGADRSPYLTQLAAGDHIFIDDHNGNIARAVCGTPVDHGGWWEFPFTPSGTYPMAAEPPNGANVDFGWMSASGGGGGGSAIDVDEDGVGVVSAVDQLSFRHGLDVTTPGGTEARIAVDESELTHNSLGGLTTGDPHTQYRLEADDHSHASSGLQGGTVAHSALTGLTTGNPHTQYALAGGVGLTYCLMVYVTGSGSVVPAGEFSVAEPRPSARTAYVPVIAALVAMPNPLLMSCVPEVICPFPSA